MTSLPISCDGHVTKWLPASSRLVKTLMARRHWQTAHWYTLLRLLADYTIINNFHAGDFDSLPNSKVLGEKVS